MYTRKYLQKHYPLFQEPPEGYSLDEVEVRRITPRERPLWDALMNEYHYLGFQRLAAHGMRYVAVWRGQWLALAAWQNGVLKCKPRDDWIGWRGDRHYRRLGLTANNTRFLVLSRRGVFRNLGSWFLSAMTRRLSRDWLEVHGHGLLVAETFCDPEHFLGTMYQASGWEMLGLTRGFARANGRYTDPHGRPKQIWVRLLRRDGKRLLRREEALPEDILPPSDPSLAPRDPEVMRSLYEELASIPDDRRSQGRKHTVACVLTVHVLATLANMKGCQAAAQFAGALSQEELALIGAWENPKTGRYEPVAKSTLHRVVQSVDPEALEEVLKRYARRCLSQARGLAGDGKRIRGANRNGEGHHETVTLVDHGTGMPVATLGYGDEGGEIAALHDLLERQDIRGKVITLDALHTVRDTARRIPQPWGADYVMTVKANAPETFGSLSTIDWEPCSEDGFVEDLTKDHGRLEQRRIEVMTPLPGAFDYPGVQQIARVERYRKVLPAKRDDPAEEDPEAILEEGPKEGEKPHTEVVYLITSLSAEEAGAEELLSLNRRHWSVENENHRVRDTTFGEDACLTRTGNGPINRACLNSIALAVIFSKRRPGDSIATTMRHFQLHRRDAIEAICQP